MDYTEVLRRLAIDDHQLVDEVNGGSVEPVLDPRSLALARMAALIAVRGSAPSYGTHVDAALDAGVTSAEIVDVLVGIIPVVGLPLVVAAAPKLAMALGYDVEEGLMGQSAG